MKLILTLLWQHIRRRPALGTLLVFFCVLLSALWVVEPLYSSYAVDQLMAIQTGHTPDWVRLCGFWAVIFVCVGFTQAMNKFLQWKFDIDLELTRTEDSYARALRLPIDYHNRQKAGEVIKTIQDGASELAYTLSRNIFDFIPSILSAVAFLVISVFIAWKLAVVMLVMLTMYVLIVVLGTVRTAKLQDEVNRLWVKPTGRAFDAAMNIFSVKSGAQEDRELQIMRNYHAEGLAKQNRINWQWAILEGMHFFTLTRILLLGISVLLLVEGKITLGEMYFFQFSFFRVLTPFEMLGGILPQWNKSIGKLKMSEELLKKELEPGFREKGVTLENLKGEIRFDDVCFSYVSQNAHAEHHANDPEEEWRSTLQHINLTIAPGEHLALVGHSGAGKSTIAMLLNRFYDVTCGKILIDGTDMNEVDVEWWRSQIGLVLQDNLMFNDTVFNNIRYARPDATDAEVQEAAKRASADDFIHELPHGYATEVGERGVKLSGGQRQRLAIARAILKQPKIVILDEATSALDSVTEKAVQQGIKSLLENRTAVIIAHRLSTVQHCDRIAVLDKGNLVAIGPHAELMRISPLYKEMVELQNKGLLAE